MTPARGAVVALRALGLGDFLTAIPALRALRRSYRRHPVLLAGPEGLTPLARLSGAVDGVIPAAGLGPLAPAGPVAVAVNLHGRGPQSHRLLQALHPDGLIAFGNRAAGHSGPAWRDEEHEVMRWCRLLDAHGLPADPADLLLPDPGYAELAVPGATLIHPGAAFPARRWPPERWAAVARAEREAGHHVVVTGGPDETGLADEVVCRAGLDRTDDLSGRTDALELARLVAHAGLVLCGDTGVAHLASAFGTPSVVLFGPTSPERWGPPRGGPHVALWAGIFGDPHGAEVDPGLLLIGVDDVLAAMNRVLPARPNADTAADNRGQGISPERDPAAASPDRATRRHRELAVPRSAGA